MYKKVRELKGGETIRVRGTMNTLRNITLVDNDGFSVKIYGNTKSDKMDVMELALITEVWVY